MSEVKKDPIRALFLVADEEMAEKAAQMFVKEGIPLQYMMRAMGTAPSEILEILGISSTEKQLMMSILPKSKAVEMMRKLYTHLHLGMPGMPGSGITFTVPLTGLSKQVMNMVDGIGAADPHRKEEVFMAENKHALIVAVVNQGCSEDVMTAARGAGAGGGTVLHCRRVSDEKTVSLFGLSLQEEREFVMIVTTNEHKMDIMQAIGEKCGLLTDAKGLVFSLPIDNIIGLKIFE